MADQEYVAEQYITVKGKTSLFKSIEEYIDAKIDFRTLPVRPSLNQEQVEERMSKAKEDLESKIMVLKISVVKQ